MENGGFLEKLYQGKFDRALFTSCHGSKTSDESRAILNGYLALSSGYSPRAVEEAGELPEELWEGLKETGMFALTIPKEYGGTGLPLSDYLGIIEAAAALDMSLAIIPLAHHSIGLKGSDPLRFGSTEEAISPARRHR